MKKLFLALAFIAAGLFGAETGPVRLVLNPEGTSGGQTGELRFYELVANGGQYVGLKAPDTIATTLHFILPATDGTTGQALVTNGSGVLSWANASGGLADGTYGDIVVSGTGTVLTVGNNAITTAKINNSAVTYAKIANATANSVVGRASNSSGVVADIVGGTDDRVLSQTSGTLSFTTISTAMIASNAITTAKITDANVTYAKIENGTGLSVLGRATNSAGVNADIVAGSDGQVLYRSGTSLIFGTLPGGGGLLSGTSGGIPYFNTSTTQASSGALTASQIVLGGGAGASPTSLAAPTSGQLLVGNTTTPGWATMSGDATLANTGALTIASSSITASKIASDAVTTAKILDANVTLPKVATTIRPTFNMLINGDYGFQQRGIPGTVWGVGTTGVNSGSNQRLDSQYGPDRWYVLTDIATTGTGFKCRREDASAEGAQYSVECTPTGIADRYGFLQVVEAKQSVAMRSKTVIFQNRVKRDSSTGNWRAAIIEWTGTADSPAKGIVGTWTSTTYTQGNFFATNASWTITVGSAVSVGTSYTDVTVSATLGSSVNNIMCFVWQDHSEGTVLSNITKSGLYYGTDARDWVPRNPADELILCQRYYEKSYDPDDAPATATGNNAATFITGVNTSAGGTLFWRQRFMVSKRSSSVTYVIYDLAGASGLIHKYNADLSTSTDGNSPSSTAATANCVTVLYTATGVAGLAFQYTAESEL